MTAAGNVLNGRFRLDRLIGRGAFAQVYLSTDLVLHRQVAVKILHPDRLTFDDKVDFQKRFADEARLIAGMEHPHILGLYDYGQTDGFVYLVMPFVDGGSLHQALQRAGRFTTTQVDDYLAQVAGALDYAHRRGIVHRDIKPQNMLLRQEDNHVLLADFGIAKVLGADTSQSGTGIIGSPAYMAPEQFQGRVGRAADLYALACVAFELLTGKPPFPGTLEQTMFGHVWGTVPSLAEFLPNANLGGLQSFFDRALAKAPDARFATAKALADAFHQAAQGAIIPPVTASQPVRAAVAPTSSASQALAGAALSSGAIPSSGGAAYVAGVAPTPSQPVSPAALGTGQVAPAPKPVPRQRWLLLAIGLVALLVLLSGGVILARSGQQGQPPATQRSGQIVEPTATPLGTATPTVAPTPTAPPPTATATAAPTATATVTPTATPTFTPTITPTPTPVPPPPIGVFGFGTVARADLETVAPEDVVETFTAGDEVVLFINYDGARPNQDQFEVTVIANDVPQPAQPVPLVKPSGFILVSLGPLPVGNYRVELRRNGAVQQAPWAFTVVAPAPVATPTPARTTAPSTAPAAPTPTPRPVTQPTPTPVPVVVPTPTPRPVVQPTPTPVPVVAPTPTPAPATRPTPIPGSG